MASAGLLGPTRLLGLNMEPWLPFWGWPMSDVKATASLPPPKTELGLGLDPGKTPRKSNIISAKNRVQSYQISTQIFQDPSIEELSLKSDRDSGTDSRNIH